MTDQDAVVPDNEEEEEEEDEEEEEEEEITRDDLRALYHDIEDFTRTDFRPGVYRHAADRRFPDRKRCYLLIVAEDYTYTVDIMFINFIIEENTLRKKYHKEKHMADAWARGK